VGVRAISSVLVFILLVPASIHAFQSLRLHANVSAARPAVPVGTIIPLEIKNTINSRTAYVGEAVYCETIYPVTEGDRIAIPAHSFVKGTVTDVVRPGHVKGKAQLSLRFESITLPDGITRPLEAKVFSLAGARLSESKAQEESAEPADGQSMAASGAGDAVIDASGLGSPSPLSMGAEGVGGLVLMLVSRGKIIILRPGTTLEIELSAPLTLGSSRASHSARPAKSPPTPH